MAKFWQSYSPVIVNPLLEWVTFAPVRGTSKLRVQIVIPPFSVEVPFWLGASYITIEFRANFRENFSIVTPVRQPSAQTNFVLAVRSVKDFVNKNDYFVDRHKFWEIEPNTRELVGWDFYTGQTICKSFALEIWTTQDRGHTSLTEPMTLDTSILIPVEDCCDIEHELLPLTTVCNLFSGLPLTFSGSAIPPNALLDENGVPILTEDGQYILV